MDLIANLLAFMSRHHKDPDARDVMLAASKALVKQFEAPVVYEKGEVEGDVDDVVEDRAPDARVANRTRTKKPGEVFKKIRKYPEYRVSNFGRVWSTKTCRFLKAGWTRDGYATVSLRRDGDQISHQLHVLVCTAFHGKKPSPDHQVRHLDGIAANCRSENLAWGTSAENGADKVRQGNRGVEHLTEREVIKFAKSYRLYLKEDRLTRGYQRAFIEKWCRELDASYSALYDIVRGRTWSDITDITKKKRVSLRGISSEYNKGERHWTRN